MRRTTKVSSAMKGGRETFHCKEIRDGRKRMGKREVISYENNDDSRKPVIPSFSSGPQKVPGDHQFPLPSQLSPSSSFTNAWSLLCLSTGDCGSVDL